jgi:hypothetical protein
MNTRSLISAALFSSCALACAAQAQTVDTFSDPADLAKYRKFSSRTDGTVALTQDATAGTATAAVTLTPQTFNDLRAVRNADNFYRADTQTGVTARLEAISPAIIFFSGLQRAMTVGFDIIGNPTQPGNTGGQFTLAIQKNSIAGVSGFRMNMTGNIGAGNVNLLGADQDDNFPTAFNIDNQQVNLTVTQSNVVLFVAGSEQFNVPHNMDLTGKVVRPFWGIQHIFGSAGATASTVATRFSLFDNDNDNAVPLGDYDGSGSRDPADADAVIAAAVSGSFDFDMSGDGVTDAADLDAWLAVAETVRGDANLDKKVDFTDLLVIAQNYDVGATTWATGNFDGVNNTTFADLLVLAQNYGFGSSVRLDFAADWVLARALVPEPAALLAVPAMSLLMRRRRH